VSISFSLVLKSHQEQNRGEYKRLDDGSMDVEEIQELSKMEDDIATKKILSLRRIFVSMIFILSCV
jgi:hypothetical protein